MDHIWRFVLEQKQEPDDQENFADNSSSIEASSKATNLLRTWKSSGLRSRWWSWLTGRETDCKWRVQPYPHDFQKEQALQAPGCAHQRILERSIWVCEVHLAAYVYEWLYKWVVLQRVVWAPSSFKFDWECLNIYKRPKRYRTPQGNKEGHWGASLQPWGYQSNWSITTFALLPDPA